MIAALLLALQAAPDAATAARVDRLLSRAPVVDGHNDLAWEIATRHGGRVEAVDLSRDTGALGHPLQTRLEENGARSP